MDRIAGHLIETNDFWEKQNCFIEFSKWIEEEWKYVLVLGAIWYLFVEV